MTKTVYLGLGSNLGDRAANLQAAVDALAQAGVAVRRCSPVYETEPVGFKNQGWFLNAVVEAETELFPQQLLTILKGIEKRLGRRPAPPNGPRTIDIDILLFGRFVISAGRLEVPHPRMTERRFVLEPLANLAPELRHPTLRKTIQELLAEVRAQGLKPSDVELLLPPAAAAQPPV